MQWELPEGFKEGGAVKGPDLGLVGVALAAGWKIDRECQEWNLGGQ